MIPVLWRGPHGREKPFTMGACGDNQHIVVDQEAQSWLDTAFKGLCLATHLLAWLYGLQALCAKAF